MIDFLIALIFAYTCHGGPQIENWYEYTAGRQFDALTTSIRLQTTSGVRWLYVFDKRVLFLTGLDTEHGVCAREL
jgi:hypothetical protein